MNNKSLWSHFIKIVFSLHKKISKKAPNFEPATVMLPLNNL